MASTRVKAHASASFARSSLVVLSATALGGALNYLYALVAARSLGPADYGVLGSFLSLINLALIPSGVIGLVAVRFVADAAARGDERSVRALVRTMGWRTLVVATLTASVFALSIPWLAQFLHIRQIAWFLIFDAAMVAMVFMHLNRSVLQGLQRFGSYAVNWVVEPTVKLGALIALIAAGFGVTGALWALVVGSAIAWLVAFIQLAPYRAHATEAAVVGLPSMRSFALAAGTGLLLVMLLTNLDVLLAKHFLLADQAGYYVALSTTSKIIFFAVAPITNVVFPVIAERWTKGVRHVEVLVQGFAGTLGLSLVVLAAFFTAPRSILGTLYGTDYLVVAPLLGRMGFMILLFSLIYLWFHYYLAIGALRTLWIVAAGVVIEALLLWQFHDTIEQLVQDVTGALLIVFASYSAIYLWLKRGTIVRRFWPSEQGAAA